MKLLAGVIQCLEEKEEVADIDIDIDMTIQTKDIVVVDENRSKAERYGFGFRDFLPTPPRQAARLQGQTPPTEAAPSSIDSETLQL